MRPSVLRIIVLFSAVSLTLAAAEHLAGRVVTPEALSSELVRRASNIAVLSKEPTRVPPPRNAAWSMLLVGNSHTYALPGLAPGQGLRPDPGATLIDELARRLEPRVRSREARFYRLAEPNLIPLEMLIRVAHLLHLGYRPRVLVLGLTWRNMARGSDVRYDVKGAFREPGLAPTLLEAIADAQASPRLAEVLQAVNAQTQEEVEAESLRSHADDIDSQLNQSVGGKLALVGRSADLRARFYRTFAYGLNAAFSERTKRHTDGVIAADLELNVQSLRVLFKLLRRYGVHTIAYQAPERSDVPPMVDTFQQAHVMELLAVRLGEQGGSLLDARRVVPDEYWGWERDTPDRSHFTEPGHQLLAQFLVEHGSRSGGWAELALR